LALCGKVEGQRPGGGPEPHHFQR